MTTEIIHFLDITRKDGLINIEFVDYSYETINNPTDQTAAVLIIDSCKDDQIINLAVDNKTYNFLKVRYEIKELTQ